MIDTKSARGRVRVKKVGGPFSARRALLLVNGRDRTCVLDGIERQIDAVRRAVAGLDLGDVDVRGALCYPNIDRRAPVGHLRTPAGLIAIDRPRGVAKLARRQGKLDSELVRQIGQELARRFPPACVKRVGPRASGRSVGRPTSKSRWHPSSPVVVELYSTSSSPAPATALSSRCDRGGDVRSARGRATRAAPSTERKALSTARTL